MARRMRDHIRARKPAPASCVAGSAPLVVFTLSAFAISGVCWLPLASAAGGPTGRGELVSIVVPASAWRPGAGRRRAGRDRLGRRPERCGRHPAADGALDGPDWLAGTGHPGGLCSCSPQPCSPPGLSNGVWPDLSRFGASTEYHSLAPGVVLGGQPVVLRVRRGDRMARLRPARASAPTLGAEGCGHRQRALGGVASDAVRHHRHHRAMPRRRFHRILLQHADRIIPADLALPAKPRKHPGRRGLHAAFDIATTTPTTTKLVPTLMGGLITLVGLAVIPSLARTRRTAREASAQRS